MPFIREDDSYKGDRPKTVNPRMNGYRYKPCICIIDGVGFVPDTGELVDNLAQWSWKTLTPHVFLMTSQYEAAIVIKSLTKEYGEDPAFSITYSECYDPDTKLVPNHPKPQSIGFDRTVDGDRISVRNRRKTARHRFMITENMGPSSKALIDNTYNALEAFYVDFSGWHRDNNIPMGNTISSVGSKLLTDERFWPESRGRVPRATNRILRSELPGVEQSIHTNTCERIPQAVAFDQRRSYHKVAQGVPTPSPDDLYAKGYFQDPEDTRIWIQPDTVLYKRTISEPGSIHVMATSRPKRGGEYRPAKWDFTGYQKLHLWTNEVEDAIKTGITIHGIVCARTSESPDIGIATYGKWAEQQIDKADGTRAAWLKPALHSLYGILGSRTTLCATHSTNIAGKSSLYFAGSQYDCDTNERVSEHPCTNVATLGVLQAEMRARTNRKASELQKNGFTILHTHADGLHATPPIQPELRSIDPIWSEELRSNLVYLDRVSWLSGEGHTLPGRDENWRFAELPKLIEQFKIAIDIVSKRTSTETKVTPIPISTARCLRKVDDLEPGDVILTYGKVTKARIVAWKLPKGDGYSVGFVSVKGGSFYPRGTLCELS